MTFLKFKKAIKKQLDMMSKYPLFEVDVDKDKLWDTYLSSFPEGTNPMFRERTEHDCSCCKQFIRNIGNVVAIIDNKIVSVWDVAPGGCYDQVAKGLLSVVAGRPIVNVYINDQAAIGTDKDFEEIDGFAKQWDHFYYKLPNKFVMKTGRGEKKGQLLADMEVLQRSLNEISVESCQVVLELIEQNSLYRGAEHKWAVELLIQLHADLRQVQDTECFYWREAAELGSRGRIKNTVIGTLLVDISKGVELEVAVKSFEDKVSGTNYKRPTSLITQGMKDKAAKTVVELGLEDSLARRYAVTEDVTVNNVLFADRSAKKAMGVLDILDSEVKTKKGRDYKNVKEVTIAEFIENILPKSESIEVMVDNTHEGNFVSLIAPENEDSKGLFKWSSPYSWTYKGDVADSIKERVKNAGGDVTGHLRCSLSWYNTDDLDIHVVEPEGNTIYFGAKVNRSTGGNLDIDMNAGSLVTDPVENVTWPSKTKMLEGKYCVRVNNYTKRNSYNFGFEIEVECNGVVHNFVYEKPVGRDKTVNVVEFSFSRSEGIKVIESIPSSTSNREYWGVQTNQWSKVSMMMKSPNHWDGNETGNLHWFFMLEGCLNPEKARGFYNEFLTSELTKHRKVFEILGAKMKTPESDRQLSGVGFSSTQNNTLLCKVQGSFNRVVRVRF